MSGRNWGIPWLGSKSRFAGFVVDALPAAGTLVDLFAGGCAVTHAAMESGKFGRVIANDLGPGPGLFLEALEGGFEGYSDVPTREEFRASDDPAVKLLNSFSCDQVSYRWRAELEDVKVASNEMLMLPSLHERRMAYRRFVRALMRYLEGKEPDALMQIMEPETAVQTERMQSLESLAGCRCELEVTRSDYRDVDVPADATVYADPPYRGAGDPGETYETESVGAFDFGAFDEWLAEVGFPVVVSEYEAPAGCVEVGRREVCSRRTGGRGRKTAVERLFVQERFEAEYRERLREGERQGELFGEEGQ